MSMADGAPLTDRAPGTVYFVYDTGVDGRGPRALERVFDNMQAAAEYAGADDRKTVEIVPLFSTAAGARLDLGALREAALRKLTDLDRYALGLGEERIATARAAAAPNRRSRPPSSHA